MASRPVVALLIKGLGIGGAERLISESAAFWDRDRFDYRVAYLLSWKDQLVGELERQEVPVTLVGSGRGVGPATWRRVRSFIVDEGVDLVHAHLPVAGILARLVSPVPVVYTEHNVVDFYRAPTRLLNRFTYSRQAATVAVSEAVATSVGSYRGPRPTVIDNGVSVTVAKEEVARVLSELDLAAGTRLIVHVGNIRPHKGHLNLLEATAMLAGRRSDFRVVSIGGEKYPGDLASLRQQVTDRGLTGRLSFLGRRSDALAFTSAADVVVNPSDIEGLPVALLEAMALARPVVATAVGGVPDLIEPGRTGLLVPPADPGALAAGVGSLLDDPAGAKLMGERAAEVVSRAYGLERMVAAVEEVYEKVLRRRPGS